MGVGFIGLGTMGLPMARSIARSFPELSVFDVRPEPYAVLEADDAKPASSPADVARHSDVVHVNVINERQVRDVIFGTEGIAAAAGRGTVIVVHSTISPRACSTLADELTGAGLHLVDAPFSGGLAAAEAGRLTFMVGGTDAGVSLARPTLDAMGATVFHVGAVGMGQMAKIANNSVLSVILEATKEALTLAASGGIPEDRMLEILCASAGESWVARNWSAIAAMNANYPGGERGMADIIVKDLTIAMAVAHEHGVTVPLAALASQLVART